MIKYTKNAQNWTKLVYALNHATDRKHHFFSAKWLDRHIIWRVSTRWIQWHQEQTILQRNTRKSRRDNKPKMFKNDPNWCMSWSFPQTGRAIFSLQNGSIFISFDASRRGESNDTNNNAFCREIFTNYDEKINEKCSKMTRIGGCNRPCLTPFLCADFADFHIVRLVSPRGIVWDQEGENQHTDTHK